MTRIECMAWTEDNNLFFYFRCSMDAIGRRLNCREQPKLICYLDDDDVAQKNDLIHFQEIFSKKRSQTPKLHKFKTLADFYSLFGTQVSLAPTPGKNTVYGIDNIDISECTLIYEKYWFSSNTLLKFHFTVEFLVDQN